MFYSIDLLSAHRGKFGIIWLAATRVRKQLSRKELNSVNIVTAWRDTTSTIIVLGITVDFRYLYHLQRKNCCYATTKSHTKRKTRVLIDDPEVPLLNLYNESNDFGNLQLPDLFWPSINEPCLDFMDTQTLYQARNEDITLVEDTSVETTGARFSFGEDFLPEFILESINRDHHTIQPVDLIPIEIQNGKRHISKHLVHESEAEVTEHSAVERSCYSDKPQRPITTIQENNAIFDSVSNQFVPLCTEIVNSSKDLTNAETLAQGSFDVCTVSQSSDVPMESVNAISTKVDSALMPSAQFSTEIINNSTQLDNIKQSNVVLEQVELTTDFLTETEMTQILPQKEEERNITGASELNLCPISLSQLNSLNPVELEEYTHHRRIKKRSNKLIIDEITRLTGSELRWNMSHGEETMVTRNVYLAESTPRSQTRHLLSRSVSRLFSVPSNLETALSLRLCEIVLFLITNSPIETIPENKRTMSSVISDKKWSNLKCILGRSGPFHRSEFEPSNELLSMVREHVKILVIGAGGLGCELLKNLAMMGFCHLEVIDMDIIDISNLNRQFLFRSHDVGKPKANVAADFIMRRIPTCKVVPHYNKIQDFGAPFYKQFNAVVCGLDSVTARRWINSMLASLVRYNPDGQPDPNTVIPLVDGGTEGFKGHVLVVLYGLTGCLECTLDLYPPPTNFPLCTIAHTPRLPEHCIEYVRILLWSKDNPFGNNVAIDGDSPEHIQWIYEKSCERAKQFGISGVTLRLVQGVVKRIIPAVASTNAVIAAACATEVFKLITFCYNYLDNYMNFSDIDGVYTYGFSVERKADCLACNNVPRTLRFQTTCTLRDVINFLKTDPEFQMQSPSITTIIEDQHRSLYINLPELVDTLKPNLSKTLQELGLINGQIIHVSDITTPRTLSIKLHLDDTYNANHLIGIN
ncbi:unnamed protein product [Schistosoma spindalis]|nr:unnamed protein product [Schistosoma spindale]